MSDTNRNARELREENERLRARLEVAEETLRAIRANEVDAVVVGEGADNRVYTLSGADEAYRVFVEEMGEGAATVDAEGTVLYCNRRFAEILRAPLERTIGASVFDFAPAEQEGALRALLWEGLDATCRKRQFTLRSSDGATVAALLTATPLALDGVRCTCLVVTDLSDHEARLAAEAANRAKDRFLAVLSHELRTPLTPVLMTAAALEAEPGLPPGVREDLASIRRNLGLEVRLIDDLLDLSRVVNGKMALHRQPTSVGMLLRTAVDLLASDLQSKRLSVHWDLRARHDRIDADPARFQQVIWNLLRNALKFTPEGGTITLRTSNSDPGLKSLTVEVSDTGIGIDPPALRQIFDAFIQGDANINRRYGGLGMGLAISKAIVDLHGGSIAARSDGAGTGATFVVEVPTCGAADQTADAFSPAAPSAGSAGGAGSERGLRVLLVDDHHDTLRLLRRIMEGAGYVVTTAATVESALALAEAHTFDVLVSDIGLPDGTGRDLMRVLKERYDLPGVAMTGYGMDHDVRSSYEAGFDAHLTKPIEVSDLYAAIRRAICRPRTGAPSGGKPDTAGVRNNNLPATSRHHPTTRG